MKTRILNEFKDFFKNTKIYNDLGEFNNLGMATTVYTSEDKVLCFLVDPKYLDSVINNFNISIVFTNNSLKNELLSKKNLTIVVDEDPKKLFFDFHNYLVENNHYYENKKSFISQKSNISKNAVISETNVYIDDDVIIEDNVIVNKNVHISKGSIIRSGTILGTNVFQNYTNKEITITAKAGGSLYIGQNVEIQHNCCVDVGVFGGRTEIKNYVKIDNMCHIAHDDIIGERTLIAAGAKFSGRVTVGIDCWIGVGAIISNGVNIGDNSRISLGSVVTKDVNSNSVVSGNFAIDHKKFLDFLRSIR